MTVRCHLLQFSSERVYFYSTLNFLSLPIVNPEDFCCLTSSPTKEQCLMFPSEATSVNQKRIIYNQKDADELISELKGMNLYEQVLKTHNDIRTPQNDAIINSKITIRNFLNIYCSIVLMDHEVVE